MTIHKAMESDSLSFGKGVGNYQEPVVWPQFLFLFLFYWALRFPKHLRGPCKLLGSVTSGIAMFSTGIALYSYKLAFNGAIVLTTLERNLIFPACIWAIAMMSRVINPELKEIIVVLSIPAASIASILWVQFQVMEQETSSVVTFLSYITAPLTMSIFITLA